MWTCSFCGKLFNAKDRQTRWPMHKLRCYIAKTLENLTEHAVNSSVYALCRHFNTEPVEVAFHECRYVAKANTERIVICLEAKSVDFQDDPSSAVPHYEKQYGVNHLTVVLLHEFGHVLDRRGILPTQISGQTKEDRANNFAKYILEF